MLRGFRAQVLICSWLLLMMISCKKIDRNDAFLHSIYSVMGSGQLYRQDGSFFNYEYLAATSGTTLVAGDTLDIAGILGGDNVPRKVTIGDSTVAVFSTRQYRVMDKSTGDSIWTPVDFIQCRIPVGIVGNSVTVSIAVNGVTIQAPPLKIKQYTDVPSATDTTLIVEKVGEWMPKDPTLYSGSAFWEGGAVTNEGNVWFYNQPEGIFKMSKGHLQPVLAPGTQITPVQGQMFTIDRIIGFAVDIDETVLYFSASTLETTSDAGNYYITRLCKMNPQSRSVEVLNRSVFMKMAAQYPRAADLSTPLYDPAANYLPAEGSITDTKMALTKMQLALDGTLYASNAAYRTRIFPKSPLAGDPRFPQFSDPAFYAQRDSVSAATWYAKGNISSGMNNFVRIDNGVLKSLAKPDASLPVPAMDVFYYYGQQISADGKNIYAVDPFKALLRVVSTEDFEEDVRGTPDYEFSFSSKDTSGVTGWRMPVIRLQTNNFSSGYILSNGDGVFFPGGYGYPGISLLGVNFSRHNAYVYAGTEIGVAVNDVVGQDQSDGPAKWVNFSPIRRGPTGKSFFIGTDRKNNLYFGNNAGKGFTNEKLPLEIYRIVKP